jgi:hypothetical protein
MKTIAINSSSPDYYVFLLGALYDQNVVIQSPGALRRARLNDLSGGPFPSHPDRLVNVLDALAAFCIFEESGQVTAVSASLTPQGTRLWIAQNDAVPIEVKEHIESLWAILRRIADSIAQQPSPPDQDSPDPNQTPDTMPIVAELRQAIYQFSFAKVCQRTLKHHKHWVPVLESLRAYESPGPRSLDDLDFKKLADNLTALFKFAKAKIPVKEAAGDFFSIVRSMHRDLKRFLKIESPSSPIDRFELSLTSTPQFPYFYMTGYSSMGYSVRSSSISSSSRENPFSREPHRRNPEICFFWPVAKLPQCSTSSRTGTYFWEETPSTL